MRDVPNAFTVDVEDYFQVSGCERRVPREAWEGCESRVERNTQRMLELLHGRGVRATFFVLGWVAERYPGLVREIAAAGHEIGSHSYWHRLIYEQSPPQFRSDLRRSRDVLQDTLGQPVTAHRAPSFSITRRSLWALEILVEEGFTVDSSIVPARHDRYGIPGAPRGVHRRETASGGLWEVPPSVARIGGATVPCGGGGYFRLFPLALTRWCAAQVRRASHPFVFYVHPWELDAAQPRIAFGSRLSRFRHYVKLKHNPRKLDALLAGLRFGRLGDVIAAIANATSCEVTA